MEPHAGPRLEERAEAHEAEDMVQMEMAEDDVRLGAGLSGETPAECREARPRIDDHAARSRRDVDADGLAAEGKVPTP